MALITCKNCGGKISDKARKCPHCGYVFQADIKQYLEIKKDTHSSASIQQPLNAAESPDKRNYNTLIVTLISVIGILVIIILIILIRTPTMVETKKSPTTKTSSNSSPISPKEYTYDKYVLYDSEYATLELNSITSQGIEVNITSKLKNRDISAILNAAALDGKVVAYMSPYSFKIQPGKTETYIMPGTVEPIEHKFLSLCGELYDDSGMGFEKIDICDFVIGENENREPPVNEETDYNSDCIDVVNDGVGGNGILLRVTNKASHFIWINCTQLKVDNKSYDYTNMSVEHLYIPGNSTGIVCLNLLGHNPDFIVSDINEYSGVFNVIDDNGYTSDSFEISSNA